MDDEEKNITEEEEQIASEKEEYELEKKQNEQNEAEEKIAKAYSLYQKAKRIKMIATALSAMAPFFLLMVKIFVILIAFMLIIVIILSYADRIFITIDKYYNLWQYGDFSESVEVFVNTLDEEYERYHQYTNVEEEFDIALIMATVNYGRIIDPDGLELGFDEALDGKVWDMVVSANQMRTFYLVMNDQLGKVYTLNPLDRKLLAHLVGFRFEKHCVQLPSIDKEFFTNLGELGREVSGALEDVGDLLTSAGVETLGDVSMIPSVFMPLKMFFDAFKNAIIFGVTFIGYEMQDINYIESKMNITKTSLELQNPKVVLERIKASSNQEEVSCNSGEIGLPVLYVYQDYELYRQYLVQYFIPTFYIDCKNCPYQGLDENDPYRSVVINRMADEIFSLRDMYVHLMPKEGRGIMPGVFAGVSSFIFDPGIACGATEKNVLNWHQTYIGNRPVPPEGYGCMTSDFYRRINPIDGKEQFHVGIDYTMPQGTELYAMASGVVSLVEFNQRLQFVLGRGWVKRGYGWYIIIDHGEVDGDNYKSVYAHLMRQPKFKRGDSVVGGEVIGYAGQTGGSTGPHLHFEVRKNDEYIDPEPILKAILDGTSQFRTANHHFSMSQYFEPYCDSSTPVALSGNLPTAYAMISLALGKETDPSEVAKFICENMVEDRKSIISSPLSNENFKIKSNRISGTMIEIDAVLSSSKMVLAHIKGGYFNSNSSGNYIVIAAIATNDEYVVLNPASRSLTRNYKRTEIEEMIINYIVDDDIWEFEGD